MCNDKRFPSRIGPNTTLGKDTCCDHGTMLCLANVSVTQILILPQELVVVSVSLLGR